VKPIVVTAPPRIDLTYQSRSGFCRRTVVNLAVAATDPSGGTLSYAWTSSFGPAPVSVTLADLALSPSQWTAGATWTASATPPGGLSVILNLTATKLGHRAVSQQPVPAGSCPVITAVSADRTQLTPDAMTALLSVSAVGAQGDVLLYAWSSSCSGTFSAAIKPFPHSPSLPLPRRVRAISLSP